MYNLMNKNNKIVRTVALVEFVWFHDLNQIILKNKIV